MFGPGPSFETVEDKGRFLISAHRLSILLAEMTAVTDRFLSAEASKLNMLRLAPWVGLSPAEYLKLACFITRILWNGLKYAPDGYI